MNDPHREPEIGMDDAQDEMFEVTPSFLAFSRKVYKIWQSGDTDPEKAEQIRVLALSALAARSDDEEGKSSHTDGPAIQQDGFPHTQGIDDSRLESDAERLLGHALPRGTGRDVLETEDEAIQHAIDRREARNLMSGYRGGYHQ